MRAELLGEVRGGVRVVVVVVVRVGGGVRVRGGVGGVVGVVGVVVVVVS